MDLPTYREMQNFILNQKSICIKSISLITEDSDTPNLNQNDLDCLYSLNSIVFNKANPEVNLNQICFNLHKLFLKQYQKLPNLNTLGACKKTVLKNGQLLLGRAQFLAEEDHCL
jgi:hypothetical protein